MILNKEVEITLNGANFKHFHSLGYENLKSGNKLIVSVDHLNKGSHSIIKVKCDVCGFEKEITYRFYLKNIKKYNLYTCSNKCAQVKNKKTCLEKYGVEFSSQNKENRIKYKKTNVEKYGVEYPAQNEEIKNKTKRTNMERYGVENSSQCIETKNKIKQTNLEKYGVENPFQNEDIKNKIKKKNLKKYGVEYISQNEDILIKQQKSSFQMKYHEDSKLNYRGTYEKHFLDYCFENNISIKQGKRIQYIYKNKNHYYFSDFYYEPKNLIIEIKSSWTYNNNLPINLTKQKSTIDSGYNYLFIIDKNYEGFKKLIS